MLEAIRVTTAFLTLTNSSIFLLTLSDLASRLEFSGLNFDNLESISLNDWQKSGTLEPKLGR